MLLLAGIDEDPQWILLENATIEETYSVTSFSPSEVHAVAPNELYIIGDDGLLFR